MTDKSGQKTIDKEKLILAEALCEMENLLIICSVNGCFKFWSP